MSLLAIRNFKRYGEIGKVLFKYFNPKVIAELNSGLDLETVQEKKDLEESSTSDLARDLQKLGPTFVKLGQLLSSQSELLPPGYEEELMKLHDQAEPFPFEEAEALFFAEFGIKIQKAFKEFDAKPIAAASMSQVYRAILHSGKKVAVKIQRPHIRENILQDLEILEDLSNFLDNHTGWGKYYHFREKFIDFKATLLKELNFKKEAQNLKTLRENLKEYSHLVIPAPIDDFTSPKILTMEFVDATNILRLSPVVKLDMDTELLVSEIFSAYLKQILIDGFFHMDPHPGNLYITLDGKIALLDLGMVAFIPPELRKTLLKLLLAISEGQGEDAAEWVSRAGRKSENYDARIFAERVSRLVSETQQITLKELTFSKILFQINRIAFECDILLPTQFGALAKTILHLEQVGKDLSPEFDPVAAIKKNAETLLNHQMRKELTFSSLSQVFLEDVALMRKLPIKIVTLLDQISHNELKIKLETFNENKIMRGFQKIANRIASGVILAGLVISAALLMQVNTEFKIAGYPGLPLILFILAAIGSFILFLYTYFFDENQP